MSEIPFGTAADYVASADPSEIPPFGGSAASNPILNKIAESVSQAVTEAILELAANIPTDTNLADVRARLLTVEEQLADLPEGYDDSAIKADLLAVQQALAGAASAETLAAAIQQIADLEIAVSEVETPDLGPLTDRVGAVESAIAGIDLPDLGPLTERVATVEEALANVAQPYDDAPIKAEVAQLKARLDNIDGAPVNRPPTSSPIPTQMLTVGTPFSFSAAGYYSDPDNHPLSALDVTGTLPPGIVQSGFDFTGTPTATGNYTVTLIVEDLYGEQTSRSIAWTVQQVASGPGMSLLEGPGGYTLQNPGTIPQTNPVPAVGGYTLEIV